MTACVKTYKHFSAFIQRGLLNVYRIEINGDKIVCLPAT